MAWQIALKLVRQGATIEPAVSSIQDIEPKEAKVDIDELVQNTARKQNPELVENCGSEQMSGTSIEVDKEQTELLDDHSECPANQSTDKEVL